MSNFHELCKSDEPANKELARLLFPIYIQEEHDKIDKWNVLGTIGWDEPEPFIETFRIIKSSADLDDLGQIKYRHRLNTHRHYKCFSLKLNEEEFELLSKQLNNDNEKFTEWILSLNLDYFRI